jgi:hypothetical protein
MTTPAETHAMHPYANDADSDAIDGLTIENGTDRLSLYGSLTLTRDQAGLARARQLLALLQQAVAVLEAAPLPEQIAERPATKVANPFG